jgi:hypothetical protein
MSMSDIMSAMRLHLFAEVALVLSLAAFATVLVTVFLGKNRAPFERARLLPLEDEPGGAAPAEAGHE